jgi:hypothetical protein
VVGSCASVASIREPMRRRRSSGVRAWASTSSSASDERVTSLIDGSRSRHGAGSPGTFSFQAFTES